MNVTERNRVTRPNINLLGRAKRKSSSAYRVVRMDRHISAEAMDRKRERASETAKTLKAISLEKFGVPVSSWLPPGMVIAAANTTVARSAAANV